MKTLVLNWKMNPSTYAEARGLFEETKRIVLKIRGVQVVVAPPIVFLQALSASYKGKRMVCAAQDIHAEKFGAYTGGVSGQQVRDAGAQCVIVGHSERRAAGDTNDDVAKKVQAALAHKLCPIVCVGESIRDADAEYVRTVREQVRFALHGVPPSKLNTITIAYEPVYAIGATRPPQSSEIHEMIIVIKKELVRLFGEAASKVTLIYGGAVRADAASAIVDIPGVEGFILGRASLNPEEIEGIMRAL